MAGRGRIPKRPHLRQRTNRGDVATLPSEAESAGREVPPLPPRDQPTEVWHPNVVEWWHTVWRSPMAAEYISPDMSGGLYILAELYQRRWTCTGNKELVSIAAEIRLQEIRFGLSPVDRLRLSWTIEQGEAAAEKTEKRRRSGRLDEAGTKDPRDVLKVVK